MSKADPTSGFDFLLPAPLRFIKRGINQALGSGLTDEQIESRLEKGKTVRTALEELRELQESQVAEQEKIVRIEAERRAIDNTKLTDNIGRAVNSSSQARRITNDQEN